MSETGKDTLEKIGEPDRIEIFPGVFFEDKLRIVTQRRLEKHFGLPITHIFPGQAKDPISGKLGSWPGVDFNYLNNVIPLLTIMAKQVNDEVEEHDIEDALDNIDDEEKMAKIIQDYMKKVTGNQPKNRKKSTHREK
jgi:hypothetical protein